jgi:hypothetical protein
LEHDLKKVRDWAQSKIDAGQEPPWAWFQYMKLIETVETILASNQATTENLHPATHLRLVASTCLQDNAQHHLAETPVLLPM